jgi:hypothetical protein
VLKTLLSGEFDWGGIMKLKLYNSKLFEIYALQNFLNSFVKMELLSLAVGSK